jgi:hypothetical protein
MTAGDGNPRGGRLRPGTTHMIVRISEAGIRADVFDSESLIQCQLEPVFSIVHVVGNRGDS